MTYTDEDIQKICKSCLNCDNFYVEANNPYCFCREPEDTIPEGKCPDWLLKDVLR